MPTILYPGFETSKLKIKRFEQPFPNQLMVVLDCPSLPEDQDILMPMDQFTKAIQKEGFMPPYSIQISAGAPHQPNGVNN